jgi:hypothetical protein
MNFYVTQNTAKTGNFQQSCMTMNRESSEAEREFNIQEGTKSERLITIEPGDRLRWSIAVDYGYDIQFSIYVKSRVSGIKGTWVILEPERVIHRDGYIESSDLEDDGIKLPATVVFRMDNSFSWFNPKHGILDVSKSREIHNEIPHRTLEDAGLANSSPESSVDRELGALRDSRKRIDLLWMNHVVDEALMRCPKSTPEIRQKLVEIKDLLKPHIKPGLHQAII